MALFYIAPRAPYPSRPSTMLHIVLLYAKLYVRWSIVKCTWIQNWKLLPMLLNQVGFLHQL